MVDRKDHVERRLAESFAPILRKQELRREEQRKRGKAGGHHRAISCRAPGARLVRFSNAVARVNAESHFNEASCPVLRPAQRSPPACPCPSLDGTGNRPVSGRMAEAQLPALSVTTRHAPGQSQSNTSAPGSNLVARAESWAALDPLE